MRLLSLVVSVTFCALAIQPASAETLGIGSNPQGSIAYSTAAAIAKVATEQGGIKTAVVPQGGPVVTIPMVNNGELEFSVSVSLPAAYANKGVSMFKGRPQPKLRVVAALFSLQTGFFVPEKSDIKSVADLKGKRIPSGYNKQRVNGVMSDSVLAVFGLTEKDVKGVPVPEGVRGVQDLADGNVDAAFFSIGSAKVTEAATTLGGIRFLSLPDTPEAQQKMRQAAPGSFIAAVEPAPNKVGIVRGINAMTAPYLLLAGEKTSADAVYKVVKAIYENKPKLVAVMKDFEDFDPKKINVDVGIPYHAGAVKFFKEAGLN
jgi:uncharacterized protein